MLLPTIPVWKQAPFLRLLLPLSGGILLQWYYAFSLSLLYGTALIIVVFLTVTGFLKGYWFFRYKWILGVLLTSAVAVMGAWITHEKNIKHHKKWFGHGYIPGVSVMAMLEEPLIEKERSYKAEASIYAISVNDTITATEGRIILYFKKDSTLLSQLHYGSAVTFRKILQPIANMGNPGAFDYKRYCLFQAITHQVFLNAGDFITTPRQYGSSFTRWLHDSRALLLGILRQYIHGEQEVAIAEALLIGYREDIDRDLTQAYSNTGVVHVIAISGMHLAMIYGLLLVLFRPLQKGRVANLLRGSVILILLWAFALLSGGGASILRSTVMFSFLIVGQYINRRVSVYHTLSASAFLLLCYNPFFLWDVGFQLSYGAVLSIVIFLKPVTDMFYFKNRIADHIWKLAAVTLAAQVLTTPLSIYHFHQLPNLFLVSNLLIVPLSGIALYAELLLCTIAFFKPLAFITGYFVSWMLKAMNEIIYWINMLPFAVSNNILFSAVQTILLYVLIVLIAAWLMQGKKHLLKYALVVLLLIVSERSFEMLAARTNRIIVYNIPRHSAIDLVNAGSCTFIGDDTCCNDAFIRNFYIDPSRLVYRLDPSRNLTTLEKLPPFIYFSGKKLLMLSDRVSLPHFTGLLRVDIVILSKNAPFSIARLHEQLDCPQYVFDASNASWKIREWKNECDSLHLRRHSVQDDGAFVLDF